MSERVHTADAGSVEVSIEPAELHDVDADGQVLVLRDPGNQEAWVMVGGPLDFEQVASEIQARVSLIDTAPKEVART